MIGAMSKRGQNTTSDDGSSTAKARPVNLVMHSLCSEEISSRSLGSLVNPVNDDERKRGRTSTRKLDALPTQELEVGNSQVNRQEKVNPAHRKLGQKDQTRAKSEKDCSSTRKLDASSPELENMRFSDHLFLGKIFNAYRRNWEELL